MDFDLSEEQRMMKANARDFLEREIVPQVNDYERRGYSFTAEEGRSFIKQLMPFGYYIGQLPEEYGGSNLGHLDNGILMEELARAWASLAGFILIASLGSQVESSGSEELKKKVMPRIMAGDYIGAGAITEPDAGSDAAAMQTQAVLDGDEWVINGNKIWISNGTIADGCSVLCITNREQGAMGISSILVEKEVSPYQARELKHLGCNCFPTAELAFVDCRVPKANVLGDPTMGYKQTMYTFEIGRSTLAVMSVGMAQASIDAAITYARERKQFGRPIGSFQMIQELIVDMIAATEASRLLAYRAFDLIDKMERCRWQSSLAKAFACEQAVWTTSKAIQVHGAMGLSDEYPVERYFRDARMMTIPDGATQIQKLVMGREVIGIRAFT
ncbi:MAG: acyl-CoA dehydrogenase family protein [Chloroflexota bacterium]|nr:acyl-CoA dehydrogenase family protein [Chloroflexota bacterium]